METCEYSLTGCLAGTAILSKYRPLSVNMILPGHPDPSETKGRIITLEFETFYLIGTYVVNAGQGLKVSLDQSIWTKLISRYQTLEAKQEWLAHFDTYIRDLDKKKPVIWTGDLNVAPTEMGENLLYSLKVLPWTYFQIFETLSLTGTSHLGIQK